MSEGQAGHRAPQGRTWALVLAIAAGAAVWFAPGSAGLPPAGQAMLAILAFAVIVWVTEAVDYAVSAALVITAMTFLLGFSPDPNRAGRLLGTAEGLTIAIGGFSSRALVLVAAALFLAVAMKATGLDRRIGLAILARAGTQTNRLVLGIMAVGAVLSLFVPSATARVACIAPVIIGIDQAVGGGGKGRLAGLLMLATVHAGSFWNAGVKTAGAQNLVAVGLVQSMLGETLTWPQWFVAGAPMAVLGSVALYFVLRRFLPDSFAPVPGGSDAIRAARDAQGPMSAAEKKLLAIALVLLALWSTEHVWHSLDSSAVTVAAVALMFLPGISILTWRAAQTAVPWGTIALFGAGIGLGSALLRFKAAGWLAAEIIALTGLSAATTLQAFLVLSVFLVVLHLGFASAAALSSAMIPIVIGVLQQMGASPASAAGLTMLLQFTISFGFILPVNSPHNMLGYSMETFSARDFILTGIAATAVALALQGLFAVTYWHWLGYL